MLENMGEVAQAPAELLRLVAHGRAVIEQDSVQVHVLRLASGHCG